MQPDIAEKLLPRVYNTIAGRRLAPWHTVEIETVGSSKLVTLTSRIHVNGRTQLSFCWSTSFSDYEILRDRDLMSRLLDLYGPDAIACSCH